MFFHFEFIRKCICPQGAAAAVCNGSLGGAQAPGGRWGRLRFEVGAVALQCDPHGKNWMLLWSMCRKTKDMNGDEASQW